jgi:hypothetical protein
MADSVPAYRLGKGSVSPGATCDVCGQMMRIGEIVVRCPACFGYTHSECWIYVLSRCPRVGCPGAGAVESEDAPERSPVRVTAVQTLKVKPVLHIRPRDREGAE